MKKEIRTIIASLFVFGLSSEGAVSVTASRTYVDSRTSLSPVTNNGHVVGFKLGIHTNGNEVLAAKSYVDNSTPGDYATVSNAAISAAAQTNDFLRKTGGTMTGTISMSSGSRLHFAESSGGNGPLGAITSGSTNLTARAEMENYVTNITSKINDEIDYTTGNTQLVSTIESVAPVPGNYTVVSNAAMNARSMTDLGVRGAPQGEGSWFVVDGTRLDYTLNNMWGSGNLFVMRGGDNQYLLAAPDIMDTQFTLGADFAAMAEGRAIVGYTNTLAQVSQIPDVSGYTTQQQATNAAIAVADAKISTNNEAFVSAVLAAPLAGADAGDLAELSEYGSYGTVGAAILALIAGLAALKRRMGTAETALAQKADATDLSYAMVTISTPTVWLFSGSGVQSGHVYSVVETEMDGFWTYSLKDNGSQISYIDAGEVLTTLDFSDSGTPQIDITATLAGYALLDRAGNRVVVSGDTVLTLPALEHAGRLRDFLVRLEISGSTVPTITFAAPTGETIAYETDGDEFPVPDEVGNWVYSFTENCVAHTFAVALKQLQSVSQPAQGGE